MHEHMHLRMRMHMHMPRALAGNVMMFSFVLASISGIAYDPQQGKTFGPVMAPPC